MPLQRGPLSGTRDGTEAGQEAERVFARRVQQSLLRSREVHSGGAVLTGYTGPFYDVGGDYFDILPLPDGRYRVVVADIMGKGVGSAMLMTLTRGAVRAFSLTIPRPGELVRAVGRLLYEDLHPLSCFLTMACVDLDLERRAVVCATAGHPQPVLFRAKADRGERVPVRGCMLGVLPDRQFEEVGVELGDDDLLMLYSDGFVEAVTPAGKMVGFAGLEQIMLRLVDRPLTEIPARAVEALASVAGPDGIRDDLTLALIRLQPKA